MRAVILVLIVACSPRVIDLGKQPIDAAVDTPASVGCVCRAPCATTSTCGATGGACGLDGYCTTDLGTCTATTPLPCNAQFPGSKCMRSATSTLACQ